jgi:hypothetical protein
MSTLIMYQSSDAAACSSLTDVYSSHISHKGHMFHLTLECAGRPGTALQLLHVQIGSL